MSFLFTYSLYSLLCFCSLCWQWATTWTMVNQRPTRLQASRSTSSQRCIITYPLLKLITSAKEVMFCWSLFVCLSVCLSVSNITRKVVDGFGWHFQEMSAMGPGTSDYILGVIRTCYHWLQHSLSALAVECFSSYYCFVLYQNILTKYTNLSIIHVHCS